MMKTNLTLLALSLSFSMAACAQAGADATPFGKVFDAIATPELFATTKTRLLQRLQPLCRASTLPKLEQYQRGNVQCDDAVGAQQFSVSGGADAPIAMIQAAFAGAARCAQARDVLVQRFGKPSASSGTCKLHWQVKPARKGGPARYVNLEAVAGEDKLVYEIGEEQGP